MERQMINKEEAYIFPFFWLHGEDEEKLREYVRVMKDSNCRAFCVESRPHPDFCGEKWWQDMDVIIDEAKKQDMKLWILDDSHFPTGFANGAAMKAEDKLRRQSVYTKVYEVRRGQKTWTCHPGKAMEKATKQIPATFTQNMLSKTDKDYKHHFTDDRILSVSAEVEGKDRPLLLFDGSREKAGEQLTLTLPERTKKVLMTYLTRNHGIHKSYMNMMDHESCRLLIDAVYEPHFAHYGEEFGKTILGFFSDEPELGNGVYFNNQIKLGSDMDFPWSREVEAKMPETLGNDWLTLLPMIWDNCGNPDLAAKVRYRYMDLVTRQVEDCFSKQVGDWCRAHGVSYIGHVIEDCNAHGRTANSLGHYFRGLSGQDMAGIDDIGGQVLPYKEDAPGEGIYKFFGRDGEFYHYLLGKLAQSMAALQPEKQGRAMCEIFGNYGWQEGPRMEKYLADHFMVQTINHYVPHAFSPKEYPDKDCPPHFYANGHNPQYRAFGNIIAYMNRICPLVSDGKAVLDTAILYHAEGEWAGEIMLDQKPARILMEHQVDFHLLPTDAFAERERYDTRISPKCLSVNDNHYHTLLIPYTEYIRPELAEAIRELADTDCRVIFIDAAPKGIIGQGDFTDPVEIVALKDLMNVVNRDLVIEPENVRIRALHFKGIRGEILYFANENDYTYEGLVSIDGLGEKVISYNAWEDTLEQQTCQDGKLRLTLRPSESRIVVLNPEENERFALGLTETDLPLPLTERMTDLEKSGRQAKELPFAGDWTFATCRAVEYPNFTAEKLPGKRTADGNFEFTAYSNSNKKFSGFLAYENQVLLPENGKGEDAPAAGRDYLLKMDGAGEDVEVFVNGASAGIQVIEPFYFDLKGLLREGENTIRIEVATTLERERGANRGKQAPTGLMGQAKLFRL